MKIELQFLGGTRDGQRIEIPATDRLRLRIGRHPDNDVTFDPRLDLNVSGHHAELRRLDDGYYLYDMGSSNGTFVAGARVTQVRLASGAEIVFGPDGPRIRIRFVDDAATLASEEVAQPTVAEAAGSAGQAAAAALGPAQKIGARTVAMMIDSAMQRARLEQAGGVGKSTVFVRAMVNQAVNRSTRRFKVVSLLLLLLLIGSVGGFIALRYHERRQAHAAQEELRAQMARLMEQQRSATSGEKRRLAAQLVVLNRQLARSQPTSAGGKAIVTANLQAVFLMAHTDPAQGPLGFCTAFAVRRRVLGTNAHCIVALEGYRAKGHATFVVMNRNPARRYRMVRVAHHPGYHKPRLTISEDVGVVEVDADLPVLVQIATTAQLGELESGGLMYMYGFPGRLSNVASPAATLVQGVIGRVTRLDGQFGTFAENKLIQHSAFTSGGTSGSPVFNEEGRVIAVNTGGYVEPGSLQIMDPSTGRANQLMVAKQLAGYNFGIRIDVLQKLLDDLGK